MLLFKVREGTVFSDAAKIGENPLDLLVDIRVLIDHKQAPQFADLTTPFGCIPGLVAPCVLNHADEGTHRLIAIRHSRLRTFGIGLFGCGGLRLFALFGWRRSDVEHRPRRRHPPPPVIPLP